MYSYVAFRYIALVVCLALLHQDTVAGLLDWNDGVVSLYQVSSYAKRLTDIFYTRSGSHCGDTFSVILVYVYRVGRKRGHKLVASSRSNLNRFSFFSLKDSLVNLQ